MPTLQMEIRIPESMDQSEKRRIRIKKKGGESVMLCAPCEESEKNGKFQLVPNCRSFAFSHSNTISRCVFNHAGRVNTEVPRTCGRHTGWRR
jgi:hypothetical protein